MAAVSSLLVPSGAGFFAWCFASVVARPLRGRHCPGRLPWLVAGGGRPLGRRGVGLVPWWPRVRSAGPGRGGCPRLVVARPLRGRGLCLVLRIRCCPSTTWPLPPWTASLARGRGRSAAWPRGVGLVRSWPRVRSAGRVVAAATVSSLHVPSGAGVLLGASHPLLPVHYVAVTTRVGFPGSRSGAVVRLASWCGAAAVLGPGSVRRGRVAVGGRRLVVARPLRGRGLAWCFASVVARPLRGRYRPGRLCWFVVGGGRPLGGLGGRWPWRVSQPVTAPALSSGPKPDPDETPKARDEA
ncbi:hypothetical protein ABIA38_001272 [Embleya sp. AB8]